MYVIGERGSKCLFRGEHDLDHAGQRTSGIE